VWLFNAVFIGRNKINFCPCSCKVRSLSLSFRHLVNTAWNNRLVWTVRCWTNEQNLLQKCPRICDKLRFSWWDILFSRTLYVACSSHNEDQRRLVAAVIQKPQGRNFGLKSGGTNSEGERGALGSRRERGREWGGSIPPHPTLGSGKSVVSSPGGVRGRAPTENGFIVI